MTTGKDIEYKHGLVVYSILFVKGFFFLSRKLIKESTVTRHKNFI